MTVPHEEKNTLSKQMIGNLFSGTTCLSITVRSPQSWLVSCVTALWHQVQVSLAGLPLPCLHLPFHLLAWGRCREAGAESFRARPRCTCPLCMIRWPFRTIRRLGRCPSATALCTVFWKGLLSFQLLPGYQLVYLSWKSHITKHGRKLTSSQVWKVFLGGNMGGETPPPPKRQVKGRQLNALLMSGSVLVMICIPLYSK